MWITLAQMHCLSSACLFVLALLFAGALIAQQPCSLAPLLGSPAATHIFSPEQELALGDVEAECVETNYHVVHDDGLASPLNAVAARILSQCQPDHSRVRAILISDRKDIADKLLRMLASIDRDKKAFQKAAQIIQRREDVHQCDADRVALYAAAAAGFSPQAFFELFDRSMKTNASAGNLLTDSFAATTSDRKRLREIQKTLRRLPQPCREIVSAPSAEFLTWQAAVMSYPELARR